ncbi:hypothetical protein ScPMuIL_017585 [Solemya velum]
MSSSKKRRVLANDLSVLQTCVAKTVKSKPKSKGYIEGSILRIKLENILTYDSVEFHTGPFLNVVIGPNGTGKSTIVCAICLGLAGKTSWLGRASQASDFIKYGCNRGKIELELFNPDGENYTIQRDINKNNTSEWFVNGRKASLKAVEETVARLNIQVGNLCQFLPQEKVADFAKMSKEELLENTEKAVGPPDMYSNHQKLKEARTNARQHEQSYNNLHDHMEQEKQKNARLEQDVKNYEERQKFLGTIKIMEMKRPWVEYEEKRKLFQEMKQEKEKKAEEWKQAKREHAPMRQKLEDLKQKKDNVDAQMKSKTNSLKDSATRAQAITDDVQSLTDKLQEVQDELTFRQQEEVSRRKKIFDQKRQHEALQNELTNIDETQDYKPAIDRVSGECRQVNREMSKIQQDGETIRREVSDLRRQIESNQNELKSIQNVDNRRLETLRSRHRQTYDAVMWLRENQDKFRAKIHPPIMTCVNVRNPTMAKYIENHISFNDMRAFVCEDTQDFNLFMDLMRDKENLKINAVKMPSQSSESFRSRYPITRYGQYGFKHYLKDVFTCPEAVMRYLCAQYRVHDIPVGDKSTYDRVANVIRECPELRLFFTENHKYTVKVSVYDQNVSSRNSFLKDASLLSASVDHTARERELVQEIQFNQKNLQNKEAQYNNLQQKSQELDRKMNQLREENKKLRQKKDQKMRLMSQIESKKQSIHNAEMAAINMQMEEEKAARKIRDINLKKCKCSQHLQDILKKCLQLGLEKVRLSLTHAEVNRNYTRMEEDIRDQTQALQLLERQFEETKERCHIVRDTAKQLYEVAKKATNTGPNEELSQDLRHSFELYPNSLEELDAAIHEQRARADCTFQIDESAVREYKHRKKEINRLEREVDEKKRNLENFQKDIEEAKRLWYEPLKELFANINTNFGFFFKCLKCAGEVDLFEPENKEDYEKYGVRIKVKYRDSEGLRELTAHHQSGGERSVATVLYMMALQELARCPFRCVDEINQGMDPINERKVFELVVQTVCTKSASQYFLLTPKLLPDLEYADNMTVLCVFNGPFMLNHKEWRLRKFIDTRNEIQDVEDEEN